MAQVVIFAYLLRQAFYPHQFVCVSSVRSIQAVGSNVGRLLCFQPSSEHERKSTSLPRLRLNQQLPAVPLHNLPRQA